MNAHLFAVVMAGGRGTRFWPASRATRPKPLLKFLNHKSLIRATVDRIRSMLGSDRILVGDMTRVQELRRVVKALELSDHAKLVREFSR